MMRFPKISDVAAELREINKQETDEDDIDVRLQVYEDGNWAVRFGSSDYDQDHRGFWGDSSAPGNGRRFSATDVARDLIEQAKDAYAQGDEGDDEDEIEEAPRARGRGRVREASRGGLSLQDKAVGELHEFLDKVAILREDRVEVNGVIDLESDEPVRVGIVVDVTGYGPYVGAMFVQQYGHIDEALQGAFEILENWTEEHHPGSLTETFDGRVFKVSPQGFMQAIKGTKADALITEDDVSGNEDEDEDEFEDEE